MKRKISLKYVVMLMVIVPLVGVVFAKNYDKIKVKRLEVRQLMKMGSNAYINASTATTGTAAFTTTDTADTVAFSSGADVDGNSIFIVSINDATPVANDLLGWTATDDTLFVNRPAGTTSALSWSYMRLQ